MCLITKRNKLLSFTKKSRNNRHNQGLRLIALNNYEIYIIIFSNILSLKFTKYI